MAKTSDKQVVVILATTHQLD